MGHIDENALDPALEDGDSSDETDDEFDEEFDLDDGKQEIIASEKNCDFDAQEVLPRLFLGSADAATDAELLRLHGVTHILIVSGVLPKRFPEHFTYLRVDIDDFEMDNLLAVLPQCLTFIADCLAVPNQSILVHCLGGVSRSVSVVTAFLMKEKELSFDAALDTIRQVRMVYPNEGFRQQLSDFSQYILSQTEGIDWGDTPSYYASQGYRICMERKAKRDKEYAKENERTPLFEALKELAKSANP